MHAGTHAGAVQKTNISAGPKNGGRTISEAAKIGRNNDTCQRRNGNVFFKV